MHIADWNGYDHMLFLLITCGVFSFKDYKIILWQITAFTLGHSITLALSTLGIASIPSRITEIGIAVTILAAAGLAFFNRAVTDQRVNRFHYTLIAGFGLIHGLGFSTLLKSLLGKESSILEPLLAFNLGLELGQIMIVLYILSLSTLVIKWAKIPPVKWRFFLSISVAIFAIYLIIQRIS